MAPGLFQDPPSAITTSMCNIDPKKRDGTNPTPVKFDPKKHLDYTPPPKSFTMEDLGFESTQLSKIAHTEPFPLLSYDAILQHRREIFSQESLDNCMHLTRPGSVQIRGMAPRYAPFVHSFWHSPEVLQIISENAGIDLVPVMDHEIAHTNVQLGPEGLEGVRNTPVEPPTATLQAVEQFNRSQPSVTKTDQTKPIIEWHRDSHPFVCVVMLSDARHMEGGETELECGDGSSIKVKAPQMGSAVILQGRYVTHTAALVKNMPERVTIVTSFRPRDATLLDESTNMNVRNKSCLPELYYQWTTYRLEVLAQRARATAELIHQRYRANVQVCDKENKPGHCTIHAVDEKEMKQWVQEQVDYMQQTMHEMRPLETINGRVW